MTRILANDTTDTLADNDATIFTPRTNGGANFHEVTLWALKKIREEE